MIRLITGNYTSMDALAARNPLRRDLMLFIVLPTLCAAFYYYILAADVYVSECKFSVNVEGGGTGAAQLGMLLGSAGKIGGGLAGGIESMHEAEVVKEYILSPSMVGHLRKTANLDKVYDNAKADFISKIPSGMKMETYMEHFRHKVDVVLDEISGITTLKVRAYSPEDAQKLDQAIVDNAEDFVNKMSARVQADAINFSQAEVDSAEQKVIDINAKLLDFRSKNANFDPTAVTASIMGIATKMEQELAGVDAEAANLRNYMQAGSPKLESLENKAKSLRQQIEAQTARITDDNDSTLARLNNEYSALALQKQFAIRRLEITLASLETAQADALKKRRYLLRIVEPTLPESATEPRKLREILTVFFACLIFYTLGGLIIAAIKDHIRP